MTLPIVSIDSWNKMVHRQKPDGEVEQNMLTYLEYVELLEKAKPHYTHSKLGIHYYDVEGQVEAQS